jgi:hypothetical protein
MPLSVGSAQKWTPTRYFFAEFAVKVRDAFCSLFPAGCKTDAISMPEDSCEREIGASPVQD